MKIKFLLLVLLFSFSIYVSCTKESGTGEVPGLSLVTSIADFNQKVGEGVTLVFVHNTWCSICKAQKPAVEQVAESTAVSKAKFITYVYDNNPDINKVVNVDGFPTILIYKNGVEKFRFEGGGNTKDAIEKKVLEFL